MSNGVDPAGVALDEIWYRIATADQLAMEESLFATKWFDYRQLHPTQSSYLYASAFEAIYRDFYAQVIDRRAAEFIKVFNVEDIFSEPNPVARALWQGRMVADAAGMPYPEYIRLSLQHRLRGWQQRFLPRPSHLYQEAIYLKVVAEWEELQSARIYVAESSFYGNERYRGLAAQNDHHEWLFAQASKRANPLPTLARFVFHDQMLLEEKVASRLGDDAVEKMRAYV